MDPDAQFAYVCYIIYAIICTVTAVALFVIMLLVIKKVGSSDRVIPLMLLML